MVETALRSVGEVEDQSAAGLGTLQVGVAWRAPTVEKNPDGEGFAVNALVVVVGHWRF